MTAPSNGTASPTFKVAVVVLGIILGGISTWLFKLDDRIFTLAQEMATREQMGRIEEKIDGVSADLHKLLGVYETRRTGQPVK